VISAALFLTAGVIACAAAIIAILTTVDMYYLSGSRAIADDGLSRGTPAPAWSLTDSAGRVLHSPPRAAPWQLIVFSDHSLKSFPSVADGLRALAVAAPQLEIVVLTRNAGSLTKPVLEALGVGHLPVVAGSPALYGKYNVRVMPFIVFVDAAGRARASSLVNFEWQVERLWRLAQVDPDPGELRAAPGLRSRLAGLGR
jgi:hypothetical protein